MFPGQNPVHILSFKIEYMDGNIFILSKIIILLLLIKRKER